MERQSGLSCNKCVLRSYKKCEKDPENEKLWIRVIDYCESCVEQQHIELEKMNAICFPEREDRHFNRNIYGYEH